MRRPVCGPTRWLAIAGLLPLLLAALGGVLLPSLLETAPDLVVIPDLICTQLLDPCAQTPSIRDSPLLSEPSSPPRRRPWNAAVAAAAAVRAVSAAVMPPCTCPPDDTLEHDAVVRATSPAGVAYDRLAACVFCDIADPQGALRDPSRLVYEDETLVVFHDIRPAARGHLQVVPRRHVGSVRDLAADQLRLVAAMRAAGLQMVAQLYPGLASPPSTAALTATAGDGEDAVQPPLPPGVRMGFHVPPFHSIHHLHMHVIVEPFRSRLLRLKYYRGWRRSHRWGRPHDTATAFGASPASWKAQRWSWARWWVDTDLVMASLAQAQRQQRPGTWSWDWVT